MVKFFPLFLILIVFILAFPVKNIFSSDGSACVLMITERGFQGGSSTMISEYSCDGGSIERLETIHPSSFLQEVSGQIARFTTRGLRAISCQMNPAGSSAWSQYICTLIR